MTHTIGFVGAGTPHLPHQLGRPVFHPQPPFIAQLAPTLRAKVRGYAPDDLYVGLLTRAPNPDGDHYQEPALAGYRRHPIRLEILNGRFTANPAPIDLPIPLTDMVVTHIGLFDAAGELQFYGKLQGTRYATAAPWRLEFAPYTLSVMRLRGH